MFSLQLARFRRTEQLFPTRPTATEGQRAAAIEHLGSRRLLTQTPLIQDRLPPPKGVWIFLLFTFKARTKVVRIAKALKLHGAKQAAVLVDGAGGIRGNLSGRGSDLRDYHSAC